MLLIFVNLKYFIYTIWYYFLLMHLRPIRPPSPPRKKKEEEEVALNPSILEKFRFRGRKFLYQMI